MFKNFLKSCIQTVKDWDEAMEHFRYEDDEKPYVPETLKEFEKQYIPPNSEYITCDNFGRTDGMCGGCWWCMEMTPYQWHMCQDESWVRNLVSPGSRIEHKDRENAIRFINEYKQNLLKSKKEKNNNTTQQND